MTKTSMDIDTLLQQAEFQQQQMALKIQFEKNMGYFKTAAPELVEAFSNYQPTKYVLQYGNGFWDIANIPTRKTIYGRDAKQYSIESVNRFLRTPFCFRISITTLDAYGTEQEAHIGNINPMLTILDEAIAKNPEPRKTPIGVDCPFLIINGIGLGFSIEEFIKKTCIHHLAIVEPDPDMIYASMHTIDWRRICEEFAKPGRSLNLVFAQTPQDGAVQLQSNISNTGVFNCARTYVYNHLKTEALEQTTERFITLLTTKVSGLGYFDDERVGLAHTLANIRSGKTVLDFSRRYPKTLDRVPVFVVANGPSLDKARAMLEKNQHNAIIISCGTALGSLYQMGIKPDIHVEMERTRPQHEWVEHTTDAEYRKGILLLTLNTTHPDMFRLFDKAAIALKTHDIGSLFLIERLQKIAYNAHLDRCNPTVGNAGLAFACALGFQSIYLVGLDLGFPQSGQHHSKYSAHYRVKEEALKSLDMEIKESDSNTVVPGNFGGDVTVTLIFASALANANQLLSENSAVSCFNTSEGVLIQGAQPTPVDDVELAEINWDKKRFVDVLLKNHQLPSLAKSIPSDKAIVEQFQEVARTMERLKNLAATLPNNTSAAWEVLQSLFEETLALKAKSQYGSMYLLIKGSIDAYLLVLARALYIHADETNVMAIYKSLLVHFNAFIDQCTNSLKYELFVLDHREQNLITKLNK